MASIPLEIVVDDAEGLRIAAKAGVQRIELCGALALGGLTPPAGLMRMAAGCGVPVHAMIRPRAGDFLFSPNDLAVALDDIRMAREVGLAGIVIGVTRADGRLDTEAMARQISAAHGMWVTIHRAFDATPDPDQALDDAIGLGVTRIMTAGHAPTALEGAATLRRLVSRAGGRVRIMAGGGVAPGHVAALIGAGVDELHASASVLRPVEGPLGSLKIAPERPRTDGDAIAALQRAIAAA